MLFVLVLLGVLVRMVLLATAENRFDADEATIGMMALDILEGEALPFTVYGTHYDGGGAQEAYLGAVAFALVGASAWALKLCILLLWALTALLLADLCRRTLRAAAIPTLLFYCAGTPFFLEWSLKARGGFAETPLITVWLLWLADPPERLRERTFLLAAGFGAAVGIGLWSSEMLLPVLPIAAVWFLYRRPVGTRRRALGGLALGGLIGLLPLIVYNATHDWGSLRESALVGIVTGPGGEPLSGPELLLSARFVLGTAWWVLLTGLLVAVVRLARQAGKWNLGHVCLAHMLVYVAGYWLAGNRYLQIPPSRVLYPLYPSLAVVLGCAVAGPRGVTAWIGRAAVAIWLALLAVSVAAWIASAAPREAGSWRGRWSLVDGDELYRELREREVEVVYVPYWTVRQLEFAARVHARREESRSPAPMIFSSVVPPSPLPESVHAAFALDRESPDLKQVEEALDRAGIHYQRADWEDLAILWDMDGRSTHVGIGLPAHFGLGALPPLTQPLDGFN